MKVGDWLQFTGIKNQVEHALHLFRIYVRSKGNDKNKSAVEAIEDIFNRYKRLENEIGDL